MSCCVESWWPGLGEEWDPQLGTCGSHPAPAPAAAGTFPWPRQMCPILPHHCQDLLFLLAFSFGKKPARLGEGSRGRQMPADGQRSPWEHKAGGRGCGLVPAWGHSPASASRVPSLLHHRLCFFSQKKSPKGMSRQNRRLRKTLCPGIIKKKN